MDNIQRIYSFSQRFSDDDLDNNNIKTKKFIFCISFLDIDTIWTKIFAGFKTTKIDAQRILERGHNFGLSHFGKK